MLKFLIDLMGESQFDQKEGRHVFYSTLKYKCFHGVIVFRTTVLKLFKGE